MSGFKLYQHVHIAVGAEVISQGGSEKGQPANVVSTTEASYLPFGNPIGFVPASRGGVYIESTMITSEKAFEGERAGSRSFWAGALRIVLPWGLVLLWLGCIYLVGQTTAFPLRGHEDIVRLVVRKGVHVGEYALLLVLLYGALNGWRKRFRISLALLAGALVVAVGVADEWRQSFIPLRSANTMDIGFDVLGAMLGQAFTWFWVTVKRF